MALVKVRVIRFDDDRRCGASDGEMIIIREMMMLSDIMPNVGDQIALQYGVNLVPVYPPTKVLEIRRVYDLTAGSALISTDIVVE